MSKLTAAIIEDEVPAARLLSSIITRLRPDWEVTVLPGTQDPAIAAIKRLKSDVNHCSESTQENFGNDSDMVNAMLLTLIDRCGDDDNLAYKMYEYIKSFPSKLNLDLDLDNAFSHLFKKEKL